MAKTVKSAVLYFREGSSDKEYRVVLEDDGGSYSVNAYFGRRGGNLKAAPQGSGFDLAKAEQVFATTVNGKTKKGYKLDGDANGEVFAGLKERTDTGLRAQLLTMIDRDEAMRLIKDDSIGLEEKFDGERLICEKKDDGTLVFANRNGQQTNVTREIERAISDLPGSFIVDGENVTGTFYIFDMLAQNGKDMRPMGAEDRNAALGTFLGETAPPLFYVPLIIGTDQKLKEFLRIEAEGGEGAVFKKRSGHYYAGKVENGGNQFKCKFWESLSAICAGHNDKSSISLELFEDGKRINVGNVTVQEKPPIESIVEIRYLYVAAKGGSLYQPVFIAVRSDIAAEECTTSQIKYKGNVA